MATTPVYNTTDHSILVDLGGGRYEEIDEGGSYDAPDESTAARLVSGHSGALSLLNVGGGVGAALDRQVAAASALTEDEETIPREAIVGDDASVPGSGSFVSAAQVNAERTQGEQTGDEADTAAVAEPVGGEDAGQTNADVDTETPVREAEERAASRGRGNRSRS